jgi:hypothetical protein
MAEIYAARPPPVIHGCDRRVGGPPVPAEPVHCLRNDNVPLLLRGEVKPTHAIVNQRRCMADFPEAIRDIARGVPFILSPDSAFCLRHGLQNRSHFPAARGLSCLVCWAPSDVDGAISPRRSEEILCDARNRPHEVRIVWTALDDCLFLDEGLILPVQVEPRLDRDWAVYTQPLFVEQSVHKIAHFSSCIRIQPDCPLDAIRCGCIPCCWRKTPVGEPDLSHVRSKKPR